MKSMRAVEDEVERCCDEDFSGREVSGKKNVTVEDKTGGETLSGGGESGKRCDRDRYK